MSNLKSGQYVPKYCMPGDFVDGQILTRYSPKGRYSIVHARGSGLPQDGDFALIQDGFYDLSDAAAARRLSGDLVVLSTTMEIVKSSAWFFEWEREDPQAWVWGMVKKQQARDEYWALNRIVEMVGEVR